MNRAGARLAISAAILGATVSVFARRAPWRRHPWYLAGMVGGLAGTELSVPMAVAQLATAGLAATMGAGHSRLGVLGLLASAAS
ncbi:MAG: hypothetical protein JO285_07550, partial [Kutzneria sp.]|nr:hypothetical protein [Kutzneria sp.]